MILKFRDHQNNWNWISKVEELRIISADAIASYDYDISSVEFVGESNGSEPLVVLLKINNQYHIYNINCSQAYLCNENTGATIDVVL